MMLLDFIFAFLTVEIPGSIITDDGWRITGMKARMGNQLGNPDLVTLAGERMQALSETSAPTVALDPSALVNQFIEALNAGDKKAVAALFSADACIGYSGSCFEADKLASWWDSDIFNMSPCLLSL
jgi:hypothetical protein